jgi:polygalacturonase
MLITTLVLLVGLFMQFSTLPNNESIFTEKPNDPQGFYFTSTNYNIETDGITDVSDELQAAINQIKKEKNYGILFIPEGKYRISKTIYIPKAIRLIGYGKNRPEFILGENTNGFQTGDQSGDFGESYMFWFTLNLVDEGSLPNDANPGTFYSAFSNINIRIKNGNPNAVALRTHFAQHSFISHSVINIGEGKAGISAVGNEIENVAFIGGEYGITTEATSPSWPMLIIDSYFENQSKSALETNNAGLAIVNTHIKNAPIGLEIREGATDRLFFEQCFFENISDAALVINAIESPTNQIGLIDSKARNVSVLARFRGNSESIQGVGENYIVNEFTYGLVLNDLSDDSSFETIIDLEPLNTISTELERVIPSLPPMQKWVNIQELGALGDGETDDTQAIQQAINQHKNIYFPQGNYRITEGLTLNPGTNLIGLHPWATQIILHESERAFSGFGGPQPMIESSKGGNNKINGIGISTGGYNYRAVGLKWMADEQSLVNDVKFVGGHGTMYTPSESNSEYRRRERTISSPKNPVYIEGHDEAWDNQYWSLWITENGGGSFKDIWTANTYATNGMLVSNTSTPGRIYAMSLEHHIRNEARFYNVSNWKMYAFQFEEEYNEGIEAITMDIVDSENLFFANLWMYRTIRVQQPKRFGIRLWNSKNIEIRNLRNYTQKLWVTEYPVWDVNRELPVYPWHIAKINITGDEAPNLSSNFEIGKVNRIASGFDFAQGLTSDSKGNVYFVETRKKRIYKWSVDTEMITLIADFPFQPFNLGVDSEDNLLVVAKYDPQPGLLINGEQERAKVLPDDNEAYSSWGNGGWAALAYSIDPNDPDNTFEVMPRIATSDIQEFSKTYYPSSRWHYTFDEAVMYYPDSAFVAPDRKTYIQEVYDIGRTVDLNEAKPNQVIFASDEINNKTVRMNVDNRGRLTNLQQVLPRGQGSTAIDSEGNLYVEDGQIFVYDPNLNEIDRINLPERPISIAFGGKERNTLYVTTTHSFYAIKVR